METITQILDVVQKLPLEPITATIVSVLAIIARLIEKRRLKKVYAQKLEEKFREGIKSANNEDNPNLT